MKTMIKSATLVAAIAFAPVAAQAQQAPAAVIVTVDTQKIFAECNACKAAQTQLQAQATAIQQRAQALGQPLQTEAEAIQKAAGGKAPDAALQARIKALQTKEAAGQQELQGRQQTFQRNRAYVAEQVNAKLDPIITQVMQKRGANIAVDSAATLAASSSIDVTADVMAQLNTALPSVGVNAPAQAQPAKPTGR
jgi:Skp family chaperone for outer membrane proteins